MAGARASAAAATGGGASSDAPSNTPWTLTVHVPLALRRRGSRKAVVSPDGSPALGTPRSHIHTPLVKALARAFCWRRLIETGACATVAELAAAEKVNASYASRILRLTLLAPEIVEAALGSDAAAPALNDALRPFPVEWTAQRSAFRLLT